MGIFSRFKDIVGSNLSAMLDKAEDPEKLIRLMIQEMEETLVEIKAGTASLMADRTRISREKDAAVARMDIWEERAKLAVEKGREDLAREALMEKHRMQKTVDGLDAEQVRFDTLVEQAREDIGQLEAKLEGARERQRSLIKRHVRAGERKRARTDVGRAASADAMMRFEHFERRVERMEAEAEMTGPSVGSASGSRSLEDEFALLEGADTIEAELEALKKGTGAESKAKPDTKTGAKTKK